MEDNKIRVLRMLESGLISVEEAKDLLEQSWESDNNKSNGKKKVSEIKNKAHSMIHDNKPKVKDFTINILEKITEVSAEASKKLREETSDSFEDKKFFVAREIENQSQETEEEKITDNI